MLSPWLNVAAFGLVALLSIRLMVIRPGILTRWAAVAFLSIAVVAGASALQPLVSRGSPAWGIITTTYIILLAVIPWSLLEFAMATLAKRPRALGIASGGAFGVLVLFAVFMDFRNFSVADTLGTLAYTYTYLAYLVIAIVLVAVILWRASTEQPRVVRNRLRMLTLGTALLGTAIVMAFTRLGGPERSADRPVERTLALVCAVFLLLTVSSPAWLRRLFSVGTDVHVKQCVEDITSGRAVDDPSLLLRPLAQLSGTDQAALLDSTGKALASIGPAYDVMDDARNVTPTYEVDFCQGSFQIRLHRLWPFLDDRFESNVELVVSILDVAIAARESVLERNELERQRLLEQARMQQTVELERVNEELNQFVAIASHDLKAPIRNIQDYAEMLREDAGSELSDEAGEDLDIIATSANKMDELLSSLLSYTKVDGDASQSLSDVDLSEVVHAALRMLSHSLKSAGARVNVSGDFGTVRGNAATLLELVMNLLENAVKYRSPDRGLRISIVGIPSPDGGVEISITDNGIGVPRESREKVFAMFTRLHSDDDIAGSGIGLAVCRKIVERHGGRIWIQSVDDSEPVQTVDSAEPVGTTVVFTLR